MKSVEPVFDFPEDFYPAGPGVSEADIRALEGIIARQSSELNLRLTEILDLYNTQARQNNALHARGEIDRLRNVFELQAAMAQHGTAAAANQEEIKRLKKDKGIPVHAARSSPSLNGNSHLPDECNAGHPRCRGSGRRMGTYAD